MVDYGISLTPLRFTHNDTTDITALIPLDSIEIRRELNRVWSANFTIEDATGLTISNWDTLRITDVSSFEVLFEGYIVESTIKRFGAKMGYDIECADWTKLLQRAIVHGEFTGNSQTVVDNILSGATPDVSGLFTGVNASGLFTAQDIYLDNSTVLDALTQISARGDGVGVFYPLYSGSSQWNNPFYNPSVENDLNYYLFDNVPDAENGHSGSVSYPVGTFTRSTAEANQGTYSLEIVGVLDSGTYKAIFRVAAGSSVVGMDETALFRWQTSALGGPHQHSIVASKKATVGTPTASAYGALYDAGGNFITNTGAVSLTIGSGTWSGAGGGLNLASYIDMFEYPLVYAYYDIYISSGSPFTCYFDLMTTGIAQTVTTPISGESTNGVWLGTAHASASMVAVGGQDLTIPTALPAAPFDVDLDGSDFQFDDLDILDAGLDEINTVIVVGGTTWEEVDWQYPSNNELTHFDLEEPFYPPEGADVLTVYENTGTDATPTWTARTVGIRGTDNFPDKDVLWEPTYHWLEWNSAPPDLTKGFRVVGRLKRALRVTVSDDDAITASGQTLAAVIHDDTITDTDAALERGYAHLAERAEPVSLVFTTYKSGLVPGHTIDYTDTDRGYASPVTLTIQRIISTPIGGGYVKHRVEAGDYLPDGVDALFALDRRTHPRTPVVETTETFTSRLLVDDNTDQLQDDNSDNLVDAGGA